MSYDNISSLIGHFKALHFHNTDCLEITVHSVFEKVIFKLDLFHNIID